MKLIATFIILFVSCLAWSEMKITNMPTYVRRGDHLTLTFVVTNLDSPSQCTKMTCKQIYDQGTTSLPLITRDHPTLQSNGKYTQVFYMSWTVPTNPNMDNNKIQFTPTDMPTMKWTSDRFPIGP